MKKYILSLFIVSAISLQALAQVPKLVKDITPGSSSYFSDAIAYNDKLIFTADTAYHSIVNFYTNQLWITDGNTGTLLIKNFYQNSAIHCLKLLNNKIYFVANDSLHGNELWVTDGTTAGTQMVKDINPDTASAIPRNMNDYYLTIMNGKLYFPANDGVHGLELWSSDGTAAGTQMVKDINTTGDGVITANSPESYIAATTSGIFFTADDGIHGAEPWYTDGTITGTHMIKDIDSGSAGSTPYHFITYNNKAIFATNTTGTPNTYISDGTDAGTMVFLPGIDIPSTESIVFNNLLYFQAYETHGGIYSTDGTTGNTQMLMDSMVTTSLLLYDVHNKNAFFTSYNNQLYFIANRLASVPNSASYKLMQGNGTPAGTQILLDFSQPPFQKNSVPTQLTAAVGKLYFKISDSTGINLWYTDGTLAGTQKVIYPGANGTTFISAIMQYRLLGAPITAVDSNVFFDMNYEDTIKNELYALHLSTTGVPTVVSVKNNLALYPNPAQNQLSINCPQANAIYIYDITGKLAYTQQFVTAPVSTINTTSFIPGTYIVQCILQDGSKQYGKFIKE